MDKIDDVLKNLFAKDPSCNYYLDDRRRQEKEIAIAKAALCKVVLEEVDALIKTRYLTNKDIVRQLGWVDGHKKAIEEAKATIKKLFGEEL